MEDAPEDARHRAWSMVKSARTRLGYWDVTSEQIARLEETGEVFRTLEVSAPASGLVMMRMAGLEGMAVRPGMELFHIADLSSLWLSVELFEDQLAAVREGTEAEINLSYFPGETFRGRVRFLEPELSEKTRTMRAQIEVPNRDGRLRKGMYATVQLQPVILYTEYPGQAPQVIEDQVTYPITSKMLAVPHAKIVRGYSFFGFSFVYVIFEDGTDLYWARSRVLEYLSGLTGKLPPGVTPQLGPDATGVGWAFMYALNSPERSLAELRSYQDWYLQYGLSSVEGVSEVASIGGFVRQYQIEVDPIRMRAYGVGLSTIKRAVQRSNVDVGGRLVEMAEREFMVRGRGYVKDVRDLEMIALTTGPGGVPVLLKDVARVTIGPEIRRGLADWNGEGETVGGIVVVRAGADTRSTIERVKARLSELEAGLPEDVEIEIAYDRSGLIERSIATLTDTLIEEMIVVSLVCILFLFHFRSAFVAIVSIPLSILLAFILMRLQGLGANIMSLGGIAISIGVLVDAAIIMVENAHKHYEKWQGRRSHFEIILRSAQEVGPTLFFTLLIITVSFMPVFTLQ
ncbi:uncharacterized protein LOC110239694, partial [Exaiptasia diaphana]|uniref:Efflux RND transporter permease subunit n=1 Tax=Exaiptasia diaphana TaxID=2652724 RepID=A0A913X9M8_EXADI